MRPGQNIVENFPGVCVIHHNLPGSALPKHHHDEHEIFIPIQGEMTFDFGSYSIDCGPGKMLYIPPGSPHAFSSSIQHGDRLIALVDDSLWQSCKGLSSAPTAFPQNRLCRELLFYLLLNPKTDNTEALIDVFVKTIIELMTIGATSTLLEIDHLMSKASDERLVKALQVINTKYASRLTLADIAKQAGLSTRNMSRLFINELGVSAKQILTHTRIYHAVELLGQKKFSVTEVAFEVGYESVSNFIKNFQALTGQLPSEITRYGKKQ